MACAKQTQNMHRRLLSSCNNVTSYEPASRQILFATLSPCASAPPRIPHHQEHAAGLRTQTPMSHPNHHHLHPQHQQRKRTTNTKHVHKRKQVTTGMPNKECVRERVGHVTQVQAINKLSQPGKGPEFWRLRTLTRRRICKTIYFRNHRPNTTQHGTQKLQKKSCDCGS